MRKLVILIIGATCGWVFAASAAGQTPPAAPSVSGTVQRYLLTPHGEVDGLLLSDGTTVKFPPHLGAALTSTARPGGAVTVVGFAGPATPRGRGMKALTVTNTATGQVAVDQPPETLLLRPEQRGLARTPLTVSGTVTRFLVNPRGEVDGLVLSGGEQVRLGPRKGGLVLGMLEPRPGAVVQVSGLGTRNGFGTVVEANTLSADGQVLPLAGKRK